LRAVAPAALALLGAAACGPEPPPGSMPDPPGHLDLGCEPISDGPLGLPEPWITVSTELEATADWYDASPYASHPTERRVEALTVFDGQLHAGLGDWDSRIGSLFCAARGTHCPYEDAPGHGIPVYTLPRGGDRAGWRMITRSEEIERFRRTGDSLLIPSTDPTEGDRPSDCADPEAERVCSKELGREHPEFTEGWVYRLRQDAWEELGPLEGALHVFDVALWRDRLLAVGSARGADGSAQAAIWESLDDGASWDLVLAEAPTGQGNHRLTALIPFGDELVALGYLTGDEGRGILRYRGGPDAWREEPGLLPELGNALSAELIAPGLALVWPNQGSRSTLPHALRSSGGMLKARPLTALEGWTLRAAWLNCAGDLLLLTQASSGRCCEHRVLRSSALQEFETLLSWTEERSYYALGVWEEGLALGGDDGQLWRARPQP
jgi:hypothetical protein